MPRRRIEMEHFTSAANACCSADDPASTRTTSTVQPPRALVSFVDLHVPCWCVRWCDSSNIPGFDLKRQT